MIHHISLAAENPRHAASVIAELWGGKAYPFPLHPGSYIAIAGDKHGTAIEVYPLGTELIPGSEDEPVQFCDRGIYTEFLATHAALSVPASLEQIQQIGDREGWRVLPSNRGSFEIIEFWLENRLMIELLTPDLVTQYEEFTTIEKWEAFMENPGVSVSMQGVQPNPELEPIS